MDKYYCHVDIDDLPMMTNKSRRCHWAVQNKEAKKWKRLVLFNVSRPDEPLKKASIKFTRHSSQEPDFDGLVSGFKHVLDGLKHAGVIIDDKPSIIGHPSYEWLKSPGKKGFITIKVTEL